MSMSRPPDNADAIALEFSASHQPQLNLAGEPANIQPSSNQHDVANGEPGDGENGLQLSVISKLYIAGFVFLWLMIIASKSSFAFVYPMFFLPLLHLINRSVESEAISIDTVFRAYGLSFVLCPFLMILAVFSISAALPLVVRFGKSFYLSVFFILFVQVCFEEVFKFLLIRRTMKRAASPNHPDRFSEMRSGLYSSMAISLGYATYQGGSISIIIVGNASFFQALIVSILLAFLYIPFHCLSGYLIGLQLGRRHVLSERLSVIRILMIPTLSRSMFLFQFFFWPLAVDSPWVPLIWLVCSAVMLQAFYIYITRVKKHLPNDFLDNAGYNSLLGSYTRLDGEEI